MDVHAELERAHPFCYKHPMFLTGIPIAIIVATITGLICRTIGMDARAAKPKILLAALIGLLAGGVLPSLLPYLLAP